MKIIITGTTGMVGEGVLLECLNDPKITEVLSISRKSCGIKNDKLTELLIPDFTKIEEHKSQLSGYDACFFCAGISSVGMKEEKYRQITYDTTMAVAKCLVEVNPNMVFTYVSGSHTDSTEKGGVMWARVKGKTENDLMKLPFRRVVNFRPGGMIAYPGQQFANKIYIVIAKGLNFLMPSKIITLSQLGQAMIHSVERDNVKSILEIKDIKALAK
ncbi:NAD-dependent epimerase/dehydratase family protein [Soonwooa sp.]|uniref:NAD-dependent epimerase/dehydratase family protein n=1 Tax=Soonwooa sp. TaxID=1938592 RepID=UPI0026300E15|nr:NAD-dependent epimerase/dehydratase family protein [Soonwooa sp.]